MTDAKINGVSGSKVTPNFGSQNIVTTGTFGSGDITITDQSPRILFTETDSNPDWKVVSVGGEFRIHDETNDEDRVVVNQDGHVDVKYHLDVSGGADVTSNLTVSGNTTVTGDATFNNGLNTNGEDVYTNNGAFIASDADGAFADRSGSNIDHIWHDESDNAWNFVSDDPYKAAGNSKIKAGSFYGNGANLTNLDTAAKQFGEATSNGESNKSSTSFSSKVTLNLNNVSSNSRVFIYYNFDYKVTGGTNNKQCYVQVTGPSFLGGNPEFITSSPTYSTVHGLLFCVGSGTSRSYAIQYRKGNGSQAYIKNARLYALEVGP